MGSLALGKKFPLEVEPYGLYSTHDRNQHSLRFFYLSDRILCVAYSSESSHRPLESSLINMDWKDVRVGVKVDLHI